jgi:hypothetical protein
MIRIVAVSALMALVATTLMQTASAQESTIGGALFGGAAGAIIGGAATGKAGGAVAGGGRRGDRLAVRAKARGLLLVR